MEETNKRELRDKIVEAMRLSGIKLIQDKIKSGGKIVVSKNGEIKYIEGEELKKLLEK